MVRFVYCHKAFNKEIHLLRLAIITKCNLNCKYCFVLKTRKIITYNIARKSINFFLKSPGNRKILIIYGGEPILCFGLLKKIILFAQKEANKLCKSLIISVGTNGILLNSTQLNFFKAHKIKLSISLDGSMQSHNKARVFKNGRGTFKKSINRFKLISRYIKKENLCVLFGVLPSSAKRMFDNLLFLTGLGIENINIEPILSSKFNWDDKQKKHFYKNLFKFIYKIYNNLLIGNFIFLNTINRELNNKRLTTERRNCPFFERLEIYPEGEMAFSPFLINSKFKERYIVGNIKKGLSWNYGKCSFKFSTKKCQSCLTSYNEGSEQNFVEGDDLLDWRNRFSINFSRIIEKKSGSNLSFKKYILEAKKRVFE
jgi:uncharacterized protein